MKRLCGKFDHCQNNDNGSVMFIMVFLMHSAMFSMEIVCLYLETKTNYCTKLDRNKV